MIEFKTIKEYQEIDLNDCDLDGLQNYLKRQNLESVIKVTRHGIKANSWVGVVKYKNLQFEILPKLISENANNDENFLDEERNNILKNLIYMLSFTKKLNIKTSQNTELSKSKNPFLEILIKEYVNSLIDCLKRLTPKKYIREEDNLNYLRGKIKFSENIRYNCVNQAKFYCEFDEFSENNVLNQLFLFVSTCLYNVSNDSHNKKNLKLIIDYYSDIQFVRFDKFKVAKIRLSRNQELFKKPFDLAKMFVEQSSVDLSKNKFENITLVWDMNKLFEEFIYEIMRKTIEGWDLKSQEGKRLLKNNDSSTRHTFVDIFATTDKENVIIDTKYKRLNSADDFSNADVYQVSTYCLLHGSNKAILLYPRWGNEKPDIPEYYLNTAEKEIKIEFKTINLKYDDLEKNLENIKTEISKILIDKVCSETDIKT